jgi:hypothetical protein
MTKDWRFTDERMQLRAAVFRALQHHLDENCRAVYEFCHDWVSQGNKDTTNIEFYFQEYLRDVHQENVWKLESCLNINPHEHLLPRTDDEGGEQDNSTDRSN